jgi:hypothetical protein
MNPLRPKLETALRQSARARMRASPRLWDEYRQARRTRSPSVWRVLYWILVAVLGGGMLGVAIPILLIKAAHDHGGTEFLLAMQSIVSALAPCAFAIVVATFLTRSQTVAVLSHLPAADCEIARRVWRQTVAVSAVAIYLELLIYGFVAWVEGFGRTGWGLAAVLAIAQWVIGISVGTVLAALFPRRVSEFILIAVVPALIIYLFAGAPHHQAVATPAFLTLPSGWLNAFLAWGVLKGLAGSTYAIVPAALCCAAGIWALMRLLRQYRVEEFEIRQGEVTAIIVEQPRMARESEEFTRGLFGDVFALPPEETFVLSEDEARHQILSRKFLEFPQPETHGWIERLVDSQLKQRERAILEFLTGGHREWTANWKHLFATTAFFIGVAWIGDLRGVGPAVYLICAAIAAMNVYSGPWPAFGIRSCGGTFLAPISSLPIGFEETCRVLAKGVLLRGLASLAIICPALLLNMLQLPFWPASGIILGLWIYALLIAGASWQSVCLFTVGTSFPTFGLRNLLLVLAQMALLLVGVLSAEGALVAAMFLGMGPAAQKNVIPMAVLAISFGLLGTTSALYWLLFRRIYQRGILDLMRNRKSNWSKQLEQHERLQARNRRYAAVRREYGWFWWLKRDQILADRSRGRTAPIEHVKRR